MSETATPAAATAFYTYSDDEDTKKSFRFRRPTVSELDKMSSNAKKIPLTSAIEMTKVLCAEPDKAGWSTFIEDFPGAASAVITEVMAKLKFRSQQ
jgi:hypothetical protein